MRVLRRWILAAAFAALAPLAQAEAQSVRGRVLDAETGQVIAGVQVELVNARGAVETRAVSNDRGVFILAVREGGNFQLRTVHLAYRDITTAVEVKTGEEISVDVKLSSRAVALEPLTVTARRPDPRHELTYDGMLARHAQFPPIGSRRVLLWDDPDLMAVGTVAELMTSITIRPRCSVVFWNGNLVQDAESAQDWINDPVIPHLEAVEFYARWTDAPLDFQQTPFYLRDEFIQNCNVLALWQARSRRGWVGFNPPFRARLNVGAAFQQVAGQHAPQEAPVLNADFHWPLYRGLSIGVHSRLASAVIAPQTLDELTSGMAHGSAELGSRRFTTLSYGLETRLEIMRRAPVRPVVSARLSAARRSFNPFITENSRNLVSKGTGVGFSVGVERSFSRTLIAHVMIDHDRLSFDPYYTLESATLSTASSWNSTALRVGLGYSILR
jgi:hypothetical protein